MHLPSQYSQPWNFIAKVFKLSSMCWIRDELMLNNYKNSLTSINNTVTPDLSAVLVIVCSVLVVVA